jgi:hypothetical protein
MKAATNGKNELGQDSTGRLHDELVCSAAICVLPEEEKG